MPNVVAKTRLKYAKTTLFSFPVSEFCGKGAVCPLPLYFFATACVKVRLSLTPMSPPLHIPCFLLATRALLLALALFLWAVGSSVAFGADGLDKTERETFLRSVYVLRSFSSHARQESLAIPRRVVTADATESLLRHHDSKLVLRQIAGDFATIGNRHEDAALYEAYARLELGQNKEAAALLESYVGTAPFEARRYALLCKTLRGLDDWLTMYIMAKEWAERSSACRAEQVEAEWQALYGLGRFAEAAALAGKQAPCLGWPAGVYEASAINAMGKNREAAALIARAIDSFQGKETEIIRLWTEYNRYPQSVPQE